MILIWITGSTFALWILTLFVVYLYTAVSTFLSRNEGFSNRSIRSRRAIAGSATLLALLLSVVFLFSFAKLMGPKDYVAENLKRTAPKIPPRLEGINEKRWTESERMQHSQEWHQVQSELHKDGK